MPESLKSPRTARAAIAVREASDGLELIEPREAAEAPFAAGQSPSLVARRALLLMLAEGAAAGFANKRYRLSKAALRQGHKGNERIGALIDEVLSIRLAVPGISSRGRSAILKSVMFEEIAEETADDDDAWVEFQFSNRARTVFGASEVYASMSKAAVMAFQGKYAVTLYQLGSLYCGRRKPTIRLTVPELREQLGIPDGRYANWSEIRRFVLTPAREEIEHMAHFQVSMREIREGRRVIAVELGFWLKGEQEIEAAAAEVAQPRIGRKARRTGKVDEIARNQNALGKQIAIRLGKKA